MARLEERNALIVREEVLVRSGGGECLEESTLELKITKRDKEQRKR